MYNRTLSILNEAEKLIVDVPSEMPLNGLAGKVLEKLSTNIFLVKPFIGTGVHLLLSPLRKWMYMTLLLSVLFIVLHILASESRFIWQPLILSASILTLPFILFSVPSTYASNGIEPHVINRLSSYITNLNLNTVERVELIEQGIEKLKSRTLSRLSVYKWYVVSTWGIVIFFLGLVIKEIISGVITGRDINVDFINGAMVFFLMFIVFLLNVLPMVFFAAYKKAVNSLYMTIELSLLDVKMQAIETPVSQS